jgi:oligosaccharide reducing-end xylanase
MRNYSGILLTALMFMSCQKQEYVKPLQDPKVLTKASVVSPYEVGTWSGFCSAAVSYTFDDNCSNQLAIAIPALNTYGFKGTFFLVTNWSPNWSAWKSAASNYHEMASHTASHPTMSSLTTAQQTTEITNSINAINSNIGKKPISLAWPGCAVGNTTLAQQYFVGARGCSGVIESSTPGNFMNISSIICGSLGSVKTNADFQSRANSAANSKGWVVFLIHGLDNANDGYSPTSSTEFKNSLSFFNSNRSKFWFSSFGGVCRYIKERNAVTLTQTASDASSFTIRLTDNLDNSIYNVGITIRRPLPTGWTNAGVTQNGAAITSSIVSVNSTNYVMFNAIPDGGDVKITKK